MKDENKWYPWDNWYSSPLFWTKWIFILLGIIVIIGISTCSYHHHKYICIEGHYYTSYDRFQNKDFVWCCDKEMLRSEFEKQDKIKAACGCH